MPTALQLQRELFPDAGSWKRCQCCQQLLSRQKHANHRTKLFGLCFLCIDDFEKSDHFSAEAFVKSSNRMQQQTRRDLLRKKRRARRWF